MFPIYPCTKRQIYQHALALRAQEKLYNKQNAELNDLFKGSIDRFCEIAYRLRDAKRIFDVGAGEGMLLSLLHQLGHKCYALDISDSAFAVKP